MKRNKEIDFNSFNEYKLVLVNDFPSKIAIKKDWQCGKVNVVTLKV